MFQMFQGRPFSRNAGYDGSSIYSLVGPMQKSTTSLAQTDKDCHRGRTAVTRVSAASRSFVSRRLPLSLPRNGGAQNDDLNAPGAASARRATVLGDANPTARGHRSRRGTLLFLAASMITAHVNCGRGPRRESVKNARLVNRSKQRLCVRIAMRRLLRQRLALRASSRPGGNS